MSDIQPLKNRIEVVSDWGWAEVSGEIADFMVGEISPQYQEEFGSDAALYANFRIDGGVRGDVMKKLFGMGWRERWRQRRSDRRAGIDTDTDEWGFRGRTDFMATCTSGSRVLAVSGHGLHPWMYYPTLRNGMTGMRYGSMTDDVLNRVFGPLEWELLNISEQMTGRMPKAFRQLPRGVLVSMYEK